MSASTYEFQITPQYRCSECLGIFLIRVKLPLQPHWFCKVDAGAIVLLLVSAKAVAYVLHPSLCVTAGTMRRKEIHVTLGGRAIGRVKWTKQMCGVQKSRCWFLIFFLAWLPCLCYRSIPRRILSSGTCCRWYLLGQLRKRRISE